MRSPATDREMMSPTINQEVFFSPAPDNEASLNAVTPMDEQGPVNGHVPNIFVHDADFSGLHVLQQSLSVQCDEVENECKVSKKKP